MTDAEVKKLANAFRHISRQPCPEKVQQRNADMADLLEELLELRAKK